MNYSGKERRIHHVFITQNTEYHVRRDECVAVRDRRSGQFLEGHMALRSTLSGGISYRPNGVSATEAKPSVGESLFITAGTRDLVTSRVLRIERPAREIVATYPS